MKKVFIGIDPDVDKSGFAFTDGKMTTLQNLMFFQLFETLIDYQKRYKDLITVYIECGFLNKGNWHKTTGGNSVNAQIGQRTGANHETAKKIVEMCEYLGINHEKVKPTRSKVNAELFKQVTKIGLRTNQEQRDAYMLIHGRK